MSRSTAESAAGKGRTAPKGKPTPKARDHHAASYQAYHRAKLQWYAVAAVLVIALIVGLILLNVYTEGSTGVQV